ncbi:hypothetical protein N0V90_004783 [Kalmusia sp. IMI 367209]|nr:hypothetical protein N0V90_004783 [Kalmusia sp. IMI 367209]
MKAAYILVALASIFAVDAQRRYGKPDPSKYTVLLHRINTQSSLTDIPQVRKPVVSLKYDFTEHGPLGRPTEPPRPDTYHEFKEAGLISKLPWETTTTQEAAPEKTADSNTGEDIDGANDKKDPNSEYWRDMYEERLGLIMEIGVKVPPSVKISLAHKTYRDKSEKLLEIAALSNNPATTFERNPGASVDEYEVPVEEYE